MRPRMTMNVVGNSTLPDGSGRRSSGDTTLKSLAFSAQNPWGANLDFCTKIGHAMSSEFRKAVEDLHAKFEHLIRAVSERTEFGVIPEAAFSLHRQPKRRLRGMLQLDRICSSAAPYAEGASLPKQGVYLFSENGRPLYVGRSNNIPQRRRQHTQRSSQTNQAALAALIAREETKRPVDYRKGARTRRLADRDFMDAFSRAKSLTLKVHAGLQSLRNMRRMEAKRRNMRAVKLRFSQSLASFRQRLSQAMVRSTIQRLGNATKPFA